MDPFSMAALSAAANSAGGSSFLQGLGGGLGNSSSESSKTSEPFLQQYAGGLMGSLFFPQFAQAFASYKPQEYQQLFGQPGQKLKKTKGKVANAGMMGMGGGGGFDQDPNSPLGINGSIGQYRRFVNQYRPFDYAASNPFGRPGGPSQDEQNLLNNSYFGLVPKLDQSKTRAAADSLTGLLGNLSPANFGGQLKQIMGSFPQSSAQPPMAPPTGGLSALFGSSGNPLGALMGLLGMR